MAATRRIALLRGINVGGHRKVPMADLRMLLSEQLGLSDVATYIQSGNVAFTGGAARRDAIEKVISDAVEQRFGFAVAVVVREVDELSAALARSAELFPLVDPTIHDKRVNVGFLTAVPAPAAIAAIDPDRSPGDVVVVDGDHAHIRYRVGAGTTKLTGDYIERVLGVGMTVRNLATVRALLDLA